MIKIDLAREFHCITCGRKSNRTDQYQIEVFLDSGTVLPTAPMRKLLTPICRQCFMELKAAKERKESAIV